MRFALIAASLAAVALLFAATGRAAEWPPPGTQTLHALKLVKEPQLRADVHSCMANNAHAKIARWLAPVACEQPPRSQLLVTALFG